MKLAIAAAALALSMSACATNSQYTTTRINGVEANNFFDSSWAFPAALFGVGVAAVLYKNSQSDGPKPKTPCVSGVYGLTQVICPGDR